MTLTRFQCFTCSCLLFLWFWLKRKKRRCFKPPLPRLHTFSNHHKCIHRKRRLGHGHHVYPSIHYNSQGVKESEWSNSVHIGQSWSVFGFCVVSNCIVAEFLKAETGLPPPFSEKCNQLFFPEEESAVMIHGEGSVSFCFYSVTLMQTDHQNSRLWHSIMTLMRIQRTLQ